MLTICTKKETAARGGLEKALLYARTSGKPGRLLCRGLNKLEQGKLTAVPVKIGLMAAILMLDDNESKQALIGHWAMLCKRGIQSDIQIPFM